MDGQSGPRCWQRLLREVTVHNPIAACFFFIAALIISGAQAQVKQIRVATPRLYSLDAAFFVSKMNGYDRAEGLDVDLLASPLRQQTSPCRRSVEFSAVPLAGLTTALRRAPWKLLFVPFDKPQHELFVKPELPGINPLHLKKIAVAGIGTVGEVILRLQ